MNRKILGICAVSAALAAFALTPAVSSAAFLMDTVGGVLTTIAKDKKLVGYNESTSIVKIKLPGIGTVECSEVTLTGPVHANHDAVGNIYWTIEDAWFRGDASETRCTENLKPATVITTDLTNEGGKEHWCFKNPFGTDTALIEPHNCTGAGGAFHFTVVTTGMTCVFLLGGNMEGTATTGDVEGKPMTLKFPTQKFGTSKEGEHSIFCPAAVEIEGLLLEVYTDTAATGPTYRDAASVGDPVFLIK
jgi:hypothetical protein